MASGVVASDDLPAFPQTSLVKLAALLQVFPPPHVAISTPAHFAKLLTTIHSALAFVPPAGWRQLETAFEGAGLGEWTTGIAETGDVEVTGAEGLLGWTLAKIERSGQHSAQLTFERSGLESIVVPVAAGPNPFAAFPPLSTSTLHLTPRFTQQLTSLFQLHALKRDILILPPSSSLQSSSSSTTLLVSTFAQLLGYTLRTVHLYKELGGRELFMRRVVESSGVTSWAASPLVEGALEGCLVHLESIDALGSTAAVLTRLLEDREIELWEGKRLVGGPALSPIEVCRAQTHSLVEKSR